MGIAGIVSTGYAAIAVVALAIIVAGQLMYFRSAYAVILTHDFSGDPAFNIANAARSATPPGSGLIVIGHGWSSLVPYYAQRKSFVIPNWMPLASWQRILAAPQGFLDGVGLGGVVYCAELAPPDAERKTIVDAFIAGRAVKGEAGDCRLLSPDKL